MLPLALSKANSCSQNKNLIDFVENGRNLYVAHFLCVFIL